MIRPPPRSTRTDTLFPYTTLFRSLRPPAGDFLFPALRQRLHHGIRGRRGDPDLGKRYGRAFDILRMMRKIDAKARDHRVAFPLQQTAAQLRAVHQQVVGPFERRSEARRVGKGWVSTCRSRWSPSL